MAEIDLGNVINISLSALPQGLTRYKTNNIALFSNETTTASSFITATSYNDVVKYYGSSSLTAKMAKAIFTPSNNLRAGEGSLFVFNYGGVDATNASTTTGAISATKITALKTISGTADLTITLNGTDKVLSGMNFSNITTVQDIVDILNAQGLDCDIAVTDTNKIIFKTRMIGTDGSIALKATTGGSGTDIYGSSYLNGGSTTDVAGANASGTTLAAAVTDAEQNAFFGGVLTTQVCDNATVLANSTAIQATDHIYYEAITSLDNIAILGATVKSAGNGKTRLLAYTSNGNEGAKVAIATYATIASSTNYTGSDTCITMNLKTLTGVAPDLNLNQTYINAAASNGVDVYGSIEGLGCVLSNDNNGYTDDITGQLWIKKDLEVAGFNYLRKTNTKIPQTEAGMVGLKSAYQTVLDAGVRNGFIGTGIGWSDQTPIPFGNPEDFKRNVEELGYYIYSLPISQQSQEDRETRKAPVVQIAIKSAGAIHKSDVTVVISR